MHCIGIGNKENIIVAEIRYWDRMRDVRVVRATREFFYIGTTEKPMGADKYLYGFTFGLAIKLNEAEGELDFFKSLFGKQFGEETLNETALVFVKAGSSDVPFLVHGGNYSDEKKFPDTICLFGYVCPDLISSEKPPEPKYEKNKES